MSYANTNIILDILKNKYKNLESLNKCKVLEIGCGPGILSIQICHFFKKYTAIDIDTDVITKAISNKHSFYKNLEFKILNIEDKNCDLKKYNIMISKNCIHFVKNFENFFQTINNFLIKGGIFIIMEPIIEPKNWFSDFLNKDSEKFDIGKWNLKKSQLTNEHDYIINKLNTKYHEYETCRVYIIEK